MRHLPRAKSFAPTPAASVIPSKIDESVICKVLHGKGFAVKITQDVAGEIQT